jgi:aminopeptidase N
MPEVFSRPTKQTLTTVQAEGVQQGQHLDSLRASHPVEVTVRNALEVDQIFDHISYLKGSSVIRMLSTHLGEKTFLQGVSEYLKTHAYSIGLFTTSRLLLIDSCSSRKCDYR